MKIRAGDQVVVITGKDKGKTGQVLRVLHSTNRLVVGGVNMRTRHVRKTPQQAGQRIQYEASIHASNVMLIDPKTKKRTRAGYKIDEKKGKVRIARKSGEALVVSKATKSAPSKKTTSAKTETKKEEKKTKKEEAPKAEGGKQPFWKKMGFGADALEHTGDVDEASHMKEDHSVPEQVQRTSERSHSRGQ